MVIEAPRTIQIVLGAGRSERMGRPKPLLDFDGRTALALVLEAAAGAGVSSSIVVLGPNARQVEEAHDLSALPMAVRWARNPLPGSEQLASLQIALQAISGESHDGFFIHPVDQPLAAAADYSLLLDALCRDCGDAAVFILSHGKRRGHPVLCRASLAAAFLALPPDSSAREVLERERIHYVLTPNAGVLEDMDWPEDYQRLLAIYRSQARPGRG